MISTTVAFDAQIQKDSRTFRARLLSDSIPISGEIKKIIINKGACGESFSIGSIYSPYIEVTLDKCEEILENKELLLQIGLVIDDTVEYIDMGHYTVTKPSRSTYQTTFTAVGRITSKLNCLPTLPAEQTLAKLAAAITEATGVQIICKGVTLAGTIEEDLTGLTCRELLEVITAVLGGFATEDNVGNIVISKFSTADQVAFNGERTIADPEFSDYDYELTGVKVTTTEEWTDEDGTVHPEVSFTEGTPRQTLSMKYMTESLFSAFKANVVGYTYRPGTIPLALGDPRLDPWDCILYTDAKGSVYVVPCLSIVHTFDGGLSTVITAPGESESESEGQVKGPLVQKMERIAYQIFTAEQAIVRRITADEADLKYATIKALVATEAKITNLSGEFVSFKEGEFEALKAAQAEFENTTTQSIEAVTGKIDDLTAVAITTETLEAKVGEFGYLKAAELEAEVAEFGYLKANTADLKYATIKSLEATEASVKEISGNFATFKEGDFKNLQAEVAEIDAAYMDEAEVNSLVVKKGYLTEAQVNTLVAGKGYITELETNHILTDYAKVTELNAVDSKITNLNAKAITTDNLSSKIADFGFITAAEVSADYATIKSLDATEAQIESLSGEVGTFKSLTTGQITAIQGDIQSLDAATVKTAELESKVAEFGYAKVTELESEAADIRKLFADYATVSQLNTTNGNITTLSSTVAEINSAYMDEAEVESLVVGKGYLSEAQVNALVVGKGYFTEAQVDNLVVGKGYITTAQTNTLLSSYVKTSTLTADYIKASDIALTYATIDLANVEAGSINSAMIGDGVVGTAQIADGSITDAKIVGLTANKITAGTLDAGTIEVINLNAANITVGTINGQQIASGAIDTSKLTDSLSSTISTASANASQALEDAESAQTTADGKNTVFYQASAPSTTGRKTNDIWFDTDDGNKMYYWNGSKWTAQQFSTSAIANAAITNALIADATIQSAKIANLDAGKITTGTLDADRIAASSIVTAKIASGAITSEELSANAVTTAKIASGAVKADSIASNAITADKIVTDAVTADKIAANAVTANKILAGSITTEKIAAGAVTATHIGVGTLSAISANLGTVTAGVLMSENFAMSDYSVSIDADGNEVITGAVTAGLKIDLNNKAYYTPQITIKDNYIVLKGHMTIGERIDELGNTDHDIGKYSLSIGRSYASGNFSLSVGGDAQAKGHCSVAEGAASAIGDNSHAEGIYTWARGMASHSEGTATSAEGANSHTEGLFTGTGENAICSHAEGLYTRAYGSCSHVEGSYTYAGSENQHVYGKYNSKDDDGVYVHIVGNGTGIDDNKRSNAHTLKWDGTAWYAGDVIAGGTQATDGTVTGGASLINDTAPLIIGTQTAATGTWTGVAPFKELRDGQTIRYWLPYNGSGNATLNLTLADGTTTGAKNCYLKGNSRLTTHYQYGSMIIMTYRVNANVNGTNYTGWWAHSDYDSNTYTSAFCTTAAETAAKTASCSNFALTAKSYLHVLIRYANTSKTALTLNVNSTGAKPIYINGTASSTSNYTLPAGTYIVYYDGTNYYFRTDGILTADITGNAATATKATQDGNGNVITSTYALVGHTHSEYALASHTHTLDYRLQAAQSTATGSDANSATTTGFHYISGTTNRPPFNQTGATGNDYRILATAYSASWLQQIATDFRCDDIFYRRNQQGTWQSWRKLAFADEHLSSKGGTVSGNLVLYAESGDSPKLIFQRGDNTGSVTDWNMLVSSGVLKINTVSVSGSTAETTIAEFGYSGYLDVKGSIKENGTALSSKYAPLSHTHSYLPLSGGTLTGELTFQAASTQPNTKGIKWGAFNSKNPYIGYCTGSSDGTFMVSSIAGTTYTTGLAIGGSSGNLLWKGTKIATATDLAGYSTTGHTHSAATTSAAGFMSATDKTKLDATNDGYATCSTAAATAAKVITISGNANWTLAAGSKITVLFTNTNTAQSPTFNVNSTGAKNVYYGTSQITTDNLSYAGYKGRPMNFVYDGTQYRFIGWGYESGNTNTYIRVYRQTSGYDGNYPLLVGRTKATSMGTVGSNGTYASTYGVFREVSGGDATLTANPAQGSITATTFIGALSGNAATATKATQDGSGNVITSTYLPLSGGTLTNSLTFNNAVGVKCKASGGTAYDCFRITPTNNLAIGYDMCYSSVGETNIYGKQVNLIIPKLDSGIAAVGLSQPASSSDLYAYFRPNEDAKYALGTSALRWYRLSQSHSSVSTSDEREKSNIVPIDSRLERLFDKLVPVTFGRNDDTQIHIGFGAQSVARAFNEVGISEEDSGVVHHEFWTDKDTGEKRDRYGLAYEEFIALNTHMIQKNQKKIYALEGRLQRSEAQIETLQEQLSYAMITIAKQQKEIDSLRQVS